MIVFVAGTLLFLIFLAWGTWRTAQVLSDLPPTINLLLLPFENGLRLGLIAICLALGLSSGLAFGQLGWQSVEPVRDVVIGFLCGSIVALVLPPLTHLAVQLFGSHIYSPLLVLRILPRNRREWFWVVLALVPAVFLEELLFRSLLLGGFGSFAPQMVLAVVWSLAFGGMHSAQGSLGVVAAAMLGLVFSGLFLITSSLLAPFVAHYVINLLQLVWAARDKTWLENYTCQT